MNYTFTNEEFLALEGKYIYLKKLSKEVCDDYFMAIDNTSVETDIFTGTTHRFVKTQIENYIANNESDQSRIDLLIYSKADDKLVGEVVINDIDAHSRIGSLRIAIFDYLDFNKGFGSEGIILALGYGFGMLNLHRVELEVFDYNERGLHVYEKIGFKKEGVKREAGYFNHKYHDIVCMSILSKEFRTYYLSDF